MTPRTVRLRLPRLAPGERVVLLAEAERYLAAVDVFRAEGREPRWRPEGPGRRRGRPKPRAAV